VYLTETFSLSFPSHLFPLYDVFISPGVRLTDAATARLSGGVVMLIRRQYVSLVKQIIVEFDNCLVFRLSRKLFGWDTDCVLLGMYIPPSNSVYYAENEIDNGVSLLEQCLIDVFEEVGDIPIIVCGDLNARTGVTNAKDTPLPEDVVASKNDEDHDVRFQRVSKDTNVNHFGRYLLCVCEQFNLIILNGLLPGDEDGNFTYIAHNGSSIIDYFIMSGCLLHLGVHLKVASRIESKHMPVEMQLKVASGLSCATKSAKVRLQKYIWNHENVQEYINMLSSDDISTIFDDAVNLIDVNIDTALQMFHDGIREAAHCMQKTVVVGGDKK
jgi:hypothetical protein